MPTLEIPGEIPLERIHPNLRLVCAEASIEDLCRLIRRGGELDPIRIWFHGTGFRILDGETRWRALKRLGVRRARALIVAPHPPPKRSNPEAPQR